MNTLQTSIATIRNRGQLTIPDEIRERRSWINTGSVVQINDQSEDKIVIEPYQKDKKVDWTRLRKQLNRVSSYKGARGNLSQFVIEDRQRH